MEYLPDKKSIFAYLLLLFSGGPFQGYSQCYHIDTISYSPDPFNAGTAVAFTGPADDLYSQKIPLGFSFCFYGAMHDTLVVSSNGFISFDVSLAGAYSPWAITGLLPSASVNDPKNAIMFPWQDLQAGVIRYAVYGSSPNRRFVVSFDSVSYYNCPNLSYTGQARLYESTNIIETYIRNKPVCTSWNSGFGVHGLHNANGTMAAIVYQDTTGPFPSPGRQFGMQWPAYNDAYRFTPACSPCLSMVAETMEVPGFILYPNPSTGVFMIDAGKEIQAIQVFNAMGEEVFRSEPERMNTAVDLSALPRGIYFFKLESTEGVWIRKVVLQ